MRHHVFGLNYLEKQDSKKKKNGSYCDWPFLYLTHHANCYPDGTCHIEPDCIFCGWD